MKYIENVYTIFLCVFRLFSLFCIHTLAVLPLPINKYINIINFWADIASNEPFLYTWYIYSVLDLLISLIALYGAAVGV